MKVTYTYLENKLQSLTRQTLNWYSTPCVSFDCMPHTNVAAHARLFADNVFLNLLLFDGHIINEHIILLILISSPSL